MDFPLAQLFCLIGNCIAFPTDDLFPSAYETTVDTNCPHPRSGTIGAKSSCAVAGRIGKCMEGVGS